ncbi:MAG TPA: potassium-transporting ATPase subunit F [Thermoanaerobaculia bacterium]|nr:potassium-transporting ATPase subunit F [Thermoanaerobaculia bacterium]
MSFEATLGLVLSIAALAYLLYALVKPEKL